MPRVMLAAGAGSDDASSPQPRRVLVVDDEPDLADLTQALLSHHGLVASVAYNAIEALRLLESDHRIDAVFSDIMMPGMTGLALAEAIDAHYPHIKVVLTSGYAPPALLSTQSRSYPFVAKPYRIGQVLALLD